MAGYSARQASYTTGDTITAAHSNDEFNQVLAAIMQQQDTHTMEQRVKVDLLHLLEMLML